MSQDYERRLNPYDNEEGEILKGMLLFSSYCETYYADCKEVKRVHHNLHYITQIFQNIINKSVKAHHRVNFRQERLSMLPADFNMAGHQPNLDAVSMISMG